MKVTNDDDDDDFDDDDDDEQKNAIKAKFLSNDRSSHDDQFCPKIVKIRAILAIFRPFEDFGNMATGTRGGHPQLLVCPKKNQILVCVVTIDLMQKLSKFELSSRFFGRLKVFDLWLRQQV